MAAAVGVEAAEVDVATPVVVPAAVAVAADAEVATSRGEGGNRRSFPVALLILEVAVMVLLWWLLLLLLSSSSVSSLSLRAPTRRPNKATAVATRSAIIPALLRLLLLLPLLLCLESRCPSKAVKTSGASSVVTPLVDTPEKARTAGIAGAADGWRVATVEAEDHRGTVPSEAQARR